MDRGTEDLDIIKDKAKKYARLASAVPKQPITVLFTVQGYGRHDLKSRTEAFIQHAIQPIQRDDMFLVTPHEVFRNDPLAPVCVPPYDWDKAVPLL